MGFGVVDASWRVTKSTEIASSKIAASRRVTHSPRLAFTSVFESSTQ